MMHLVKMFEHLEHYNIQLHFGPKIHNFECIQIIKRVNIMSCILIKDHTKIFNAVY